MASPEDAAIAWLSSQDAKTQHQETLASLPKWANNNILQNGAFNSWLQGRSDRPVLWAHGLPGSGNTSTTAVVVDHLVRCVTDQDTAVAYVYCGGHNSPADITAVALLASVCGQLASQAAAAGRPLPALLTKLHTERVSAGDEEILPGIDEIMLVLLALCEKFRRVFVCVDALDECPADQRPMLLQKVNLVPYLTR